MARSMSQAATGPDTEAVGQFIRLDLVGALAGLALVVAANLVLQRWQLWLVAVALVALSGALVRAGQRLQHGVLAGALWLVAGGNWLVAVVVPAALPFLWPVMAITVLMPVVLGASYLARRTLTTVLVGAGFVAGAVAVVGLLNDDGGALPDIEDEIELVVVVGALMAQIAPIGLIAWQNNDLQRQSLEQATELNEELLQSQDRLAASRRRVVEAADTERRRIERDLHDGAQQRLVAIGVRLRLLESIAEDPGVKTQVEALVSEMDDAVDEVRELARGIYPPLLQTRGLVDALSAVARRSPLSVTTDLEEVGRLEPSAETSLYFTALEALTNAAKHAPGSSVELSLRAADDRILLRVSDDGPGFEPTRETMTQCTHNMGDRLASCGGALQVSSAPGQGTVVAASVPIGASSGPASG